MDDLGAALSYLVLKRGVPVYTSDGEQVGRVIKVLAAPEAHMFDGILFDTKRGPGGRRFVDAPEVERIHERGVVLTIRADEVEQLPKRR
jgi:PRC-barrel domain